MSDIKKYEFIDALRGLAVLCVLVVHVNLWVTPPSYLTNILEDGARGVQLFYVASAFTLFLSMSSRKGTEKRPLLNFFLRRFFRIAPLFYVAVAFWLLKDGFGPRFFAPNGITPWHIISTLTFTHAWHPEYPNAIVPVGWSVAVEMSFYLLVPFLYQKIKTLRHAILLTIFSFVIGKAFSYIANLLVAPLYPEAQHPLLSFFFGAFWLPAEMPVFSCGIVLFFLFRDYREALIKQNKFAGQLLVFGSLAVMLGFLFVPFPSRIYFYSLLFIPFSLGLSMYPTELLVNKFTMYIGKISYSMYIVHAAIATSIPSLFPKSQGVGQLVVFIAAYLVLTTLSIFVSVLTYSAIEKPGQFYGKMAINRLEA